MKKRDKIKRSSIDGYFLSPAEMPAPHYGPEMAITDPSGWLGMSGNDAGITVDEHSAMGSAAFFRGVSVIASTIATLPLKSYRVDADGVRTQVPSFLDDPCAPFFTAFEWTELVMVHLVLHGNAYLLHLMTEGGAISGLFPIHPSMVKPEWVTNAAGEITGKQYRMSVGGQTIVKSDQEMTQVMGLGADGLQGLSVLTVARNVIGTSLAGDKASARMFKSGMLISGLVSTDENMTEEQGRQALAGLKSKLQGAQNAGDIAMVNASLKFTPWSMSAEDAQFIESRTFQVEEISRLLGVPKVLLAEDGASSWGTGIGQLLQWLQRTVFVPWTTRLQQRLSLLLSSPRHCEFEYDGLLAGTPTEETALLSAQIAAGIITTGEARAKLRLPPVPASPAPANPNEESVPSPE